MSDAQETQALSAQPTSSTDRAAQKQKQKDMKKALTTTSFTLGDEKVSMC